jgi:hypothetical protein
MRAFANSRKARREDFVAGILEGLTYALPTPASMPTAVYKLLFPLGCVLLLVVIFHD